MVVVVVVVVVTVQWWWQWIIFDGRDFLETEVVAVGMTSFSP